MATPLEIGDHVKWVSGGCWHFGTIDSFREPVLALVRAMTYGHPLMHVELDRLALDGGIGGVGGSDANAKGRAVAAARTQARRVRDIETIDAETEANLRKHRLARRGLTQYFPGAALYQQWK